MKTSIFFTILFLLTASTAFGQTRSAPVNNAPKKTVEPAAAGEIPEADWLKTSNAMYREDWETASTLALQNLQKLKIDNAKKQMAQLRYIYLYSLAGKVAEGKITFAALESIAKTFIGQEFLIVGRQLLADCNTKVNYICAAKNDDRVLRVTATNRTGTAIHLFEYVVLDERFDLPANSEKIAFLGGSLKKVESSLYQPEMKVARLIFNKGYVKLATD